MDIDIRFGCACVAACVCYLVIVAEFARDFDIYKRRAKPVVDGNAVKLDRAFPLDIFPFVRFVAQNLIEHQ